MKDFLKWGIIFLLLSGCTNEYQPGELMPADHVASNGFYLKIADSVYIGPEMIDYYDLSTHIFYLKENYEFPEFTWTGGTEFQKFTVFAGREEIYQGAFWPAILSYYPFRIPLIEIPQLFYPGYVIKIEFRVMYDSLGHLNPDPRADPRIIHALEKYNQLHEGLSLKIDSVQPLDNNKVYIKITVINRDSFNYYILSPDKMGADLFHYFTTGLRLTRIDHREVFLSHKIHVMQPDPWDSWSTDWLEVLNSGEEKSFSWTYEDFDIIQPGNYRVSFQFPGLFQVKIDEIEQDHGRIWLGGVEALKDVDLN